ncbi:hypothetical protein M422DRAFT_267609 [Sphaerobolus stellatus SS14]|uniref:Uncharacterized protein n=1 Tax=Sphaerobolus stellatus (strain SS14) TaxID=990650 RepID=A0A0C9UZF7_SPHS4|nr:hypothetical protein M422DRAFT_267609 [Sphaerobolus stellatus SS14]
MNFPREEMSEERKTKESPAGGEPITSILSKEPASSESGLKTPKKVYFESERDRDVKRGSGVLYDVPVVVDVDTKDGNMSDKGSKADQKIEEEERKEANNDTGGEQVNIIHQRRLSVDDDDLALFNQLKEDRDEEVELVSGLLEGGSYKERFNNIHADMMEPDEDEGTRVPDTPRIVLTEPEEGLDENPRTRPLNHSVSTQDPSTLSRLQLLPTNDLLTVPFVMLSKLNSEQEYLVNVFIMFANVLLLTLSLPQRLDNSPILGHFPQQQINSAYVKSGIEGDET